jgi:peptidoglycan/LPS O-acetylase OafA/YrhL
VAQLLRSPLLAPLSTLSRGPCVRAGARNAGEWAPVAAQAALAHTLHPATFDGVNPPAWSLAVEAQLYLAYPIVVIINRLVEFDERPLAMLIVQRLEQLASQRR